MTLTSDSSGHVQLSERDFGPGVAEVHLAHLAAPFYRADSARQWVTGGFGLALYLCQLVAQAHGGELHVRSAEPGLEVTAVWPVGRSATTLSADTLPFDVPLLRSRVESLLSWLPAPKDPPA